jgi:hypothetical protein
MADIKDVKSLTRDELADIIEKGADKAFVKLCVEEEDRRLNLFLRERLEREAEAAKLLSEKAG